MPISAAVITLPCSSDIDSVYTRRLFSTTSRYSPVNHICTGPPGVETFIPTNRAPPTRTSILATGIVAPSGPYQAAKYSGSVHNFQTSSTGASKRRSMTTASSRRSLSFVMPSAPALLSELPEVVVHPVESCFPHRPVLLGPGRDLLEARGFERARPVLGSLSPHPQPRTLEALDVLRDRRQRHLERLGEFVHRCGAGGESSEDRSARRVGQRSEGLAQPVVVHLRRGGRAHSLLLG